MGTGYESVKLDAYGRSDRGMRRPRNEDSIVVDPDAKFFAVADGVGGLPGGNIASAVALDKVAEHLRAVPEMSLRDLIFSTDDAGPKAIMEAVQNANTEVINVAEAPRKMATTVDATLFRGDRVLLAHVGDSRAMLYRDAKLTQLTRDHNLVNDFVATGRMTAEEAADFPWPNAISRALGLEEDVSVDIYRLTVMPGDVLVLCTDGLSNELDMDQIGSILGTAADAADACIRLISAANARGGRDNVTVIVIRVIDYA